MTSISLSSSAPPLWSPPDPPLPSKSHSPADIFHHHQSQSESSSVQAGNILPSHRHSQSHAQFPIRVQSLHPFGGSGQSSTTNTTATVTPTPRSRAASVSSSSTLRFSSPEIPDLPPVPTRVLVSEEASLLGNLQTNIEAVNDRSVPTIDTSHYTLSNHLGSEQAAPLSVPAIQSLSPHRSPSPDTDASSVYYTSWGSPYPVPISNNTDAASARARSIRSSLRGTRRFRAWPFPSPAPLSDDEVETGEGGEYSEGDDVPADLAFDLGHLIPQVVPNLTLSSGTGLSDRSSPIQQQSLQTRRQSQRLPPPIQGSVAYPQFSGPHLAPLFPVSPFLLPQNSRSPSSGDYPSSEFFTPRSLSETNSTTAPISTLGAVSPLQLARSSRRVSLHHREETVRQFIAGIGIGNRNSEQQQQTEMPSHIVDVVAPGILEEWDSTRLNVAEPQQDAPNLITRTDDEDGSQSQLKETTLNLPNIHTDDRNLQPSISATTNLVIPTPSSINDSGIQSPFVPTPQSAADDKLAVRKPVSKRLGKRIFRILMPSVGSETRNPLSEAEIRTRVQQFSIQGYDIDRRTENQEGWAQVREVWDDVGFPTSEGGKKSSRVPVVKIADGNAWKRMVEEARLERLRALGVNSTLATGSNTPNPSSGPGSVAGDDGSHLGLSFPPTHAHGMAGMSPDVSNFQAGLGLGLNSNMGRAASTGYSPFPGSAGIPSGGVTPVLSNSRIGTADSRLMPPSSSGPNYPGQMFSQTNGSGQNSISTPFPNPFSHTGIMPPRRRDSIAVFPGAGSVPGSAGLPGGPGSAAFEASMNNRPPRISSMPFPHGHARFASLAPGSGMMSNHMMGSGPGLSFGGPRGGMGHGYVGHGRHGHPGNMSISFGPSMGMGNGPGMMGGMGNGMTGMGNPNNPGMGNMNGMAGPRMGPIRNSPRLQHLNLSSNFNGVSNPSSPASGSLAPSPVFGHVSPNLSFIGSPLGVAALEVKKNREPELQPHPNLVPEIHTAMNWQPNVTPVSGLDRATHSEDLSLVPVEVAGDKGHGQVTPQLHDDGDDRLDDDDSAGPEGGLHVAVKMSESALVAAQLSPEFVRPNSSMEIVNHEDCIATIPAPADIDNITSIPSKFVQPVSSLSQSIENGDNSHAKVISSIPSELSDSSVVASFDVSDFKSPVNRSRHAASSSKRLSVQFNATAKEFIPFSSPPPPSHPVTLAPHQTPKSLGHQSVQNRNITPGSTDGSAGKAKASPFSVFAAEFRPKGTASGSDTNDRSISMSSKPHHTRHPSDLSDASMDVLLGRPIVGPAAGIMQFGSPPFGPNHGSVGGIAGWIAGLGPSSHSRGTSVSLNASAPVFKPSLSPRVATTASVRSVEKAESTSAAAPVLSSPLVSQPTLFAAQASPSNWSRGFTFSYGSPGPKFGDIVVPIPPSQDKNIETSDAVDQSHTTISPAHRTDKTQHSKSSSNTIDEEPIQSPTPKTSQGDDDDTKEDIETGRIEQADSRLKRTKLFNSSEFDVDGRDGPEPLINLWVKPESVHEHEDVFVSPGGEPAPVSLSFIDPEPSLLPTKTVNSAEESGSVHNFRDDGSEADGVSDSTTLSLNPHRDDNEHIEDASEVESDWSGNIEGTILHRDADNALDIPNLANGIATPITIIPLGIATDREVGHLSDIEDDQGESDVSSIHQSPIDVQPQSVEHGLSRPHSHSGHLAQSNNSVSLSGSIHASLGGSVIAHSTQSSSHSLHSSLDSRMNGDSVLSLDEIDRVMRLMEEQSNFGIERTDDTVEELDIAELDNEIDHYSVPGDLPPVPIFSHPVRSAAPSPSPGRIAYANSRAMPIPLSLRRPGDVVVPTLTNGIIGTVNRLGGRSDDDDDIGHERKPISEWGDDGVSATGEQIGLRGAFFDVHVEEVVRRAVSAEMGAVMDQMIRSSHRNSRRNRGWSPSHSNTDSDSDGDHKPHGDGRTSAVQAGFDDLTARMTLIQERTETSLANQSNHLALQEELLQVRAERDRLHHHQTDGERFRAENERLRTEMTLAHAKNVAAEQTAADRDLQSDRLLTRIDRLSKERDEAVGDVARLSGQIMSYTESGATTKALLQSVRSGLADARQQAEADRSRWISEVGRLTEQVEMLRVRLRVEEQGQRRKVEEHECSIQHIQEHKIREIERLREESSKERESMERRHAKELTDSIARGQHAATATSEKIAEVHVNEVNLLTREIARLLADRTQQDVDMTATKSEKDAEISRVKADATQAWAEHAVLAGRFAEITDRISSIVLGVGVDDSRVKDISDRLIDVERKAEERVERVDEARRLAEERVIDAERRLIEADNRTTESERTTANAERRTFEIESKLADAERKVAEYESKMFEMDNKMKDVQTRAVEAVTAAAHQAIEIRNHRYTASVSSRVGASAPASADSNATIRALRETVGSLQEQLSVKQAEVEHLSSINNTVSTQTETTSSDHANDAAELSFLRDLLDVQRDEMSELVDMLKKADGSVDTVKLRDAAIRIEAGLKMAAGMGQKPIGSIKSSSPFSTSSSFVSPRIALQGQNAVGSVARLVGSVGRGTPARWVSSVFNQGITSEPVISTPPTSKSMQSSLSISSPLFTESSSLPYSVPTASAAVGALWRRVSTSPAVRGVVSPVNDMGINTAARLKSLTGNSIDPSGMLGSVPLAWTLPEPATPIDPDAVEVHLQHSTSEHEEDVDRTEAVVDENVGDALQVVVEENDDDNRLPAAAAVPRCESDLLDDTFEGDTDISGVAKELSVQGANELNLKTNELNSVATTMDGSDEELEFNDQLDDDVAVKGGLVPLSVELAGQENY